jgi:hypothetical protein
MAMTDAAALRDEMIELIGGLWTTQVAGVAARFRIPDILAGGPASAADVAAAIGCPQDVVRRLLRAMCALDLARQLDADRFTGSPRGELLRSDVAGSLWGLSQSWTERQWESWSKLEQGVRTGLPTVGGFDTVAADPVKAANINQAQADRSRWPAEEAVRSYDFSRFSRVLDVGGGYGTVLAYILKANPSLTGAVFDLPYHQPGVLAFQAAEGVGDRAALVAGSFFEAVPAGFDCYVMKSILHDWADAECLTLLGNCAAAAGHGGTIVIIDQVLPPIAGPEPEHRSAFRTDLTMLLGTGGRERTEDEFRRLLKAAGLTLRRVIANRSEFRLLEAAVD